MALSQLLAEDFQLLTGFEEDDEAGMVCTFEELGANALDKKLEPWTSGASTKHQAEFFILASVNFCKKGSDETKLHIICHPFDHSNLSAPIDKENETELYEAMIHASKLMCKHGRVWTRPVWKEKTNTEADSYPLLTREAFRNPLIVCFQMHGKIFAFGVNEDSNSYGVYDKKMKPKTGQLKTTKLRNRARVLKMLQGQVMQAFKEKRIAGLGDKIIVANKCWKEVRDVEDLTVDFLKKWVSDVKASLPGQ